MLRISVVRGQALSIERSVPSVGIQTPSFPSGFPPPRGIGDSPRIMHDIRGCDTHAYRGALTYFKRRALPVEIPARGEEFGARALCPCLLSVSSALGTQRARRDFQAAASTLRITGRANSGRAAAYFVSPARHSPGRRLLRLHAPNKRPSYLRTPRKSECEYRRVIPPSKRDSAGIRALRISARRV